MMKKVNLRVKVLLAFFVLIFSPLIILTTVTYSIVSNKYEEQIIFAADQSFEQAVLFIDNKVKALIDASDIVYLNNEIQTIFGRNPEQINGDLIQQYKDSMYLDNVLFSIQSNEEVFRIRLYVEDGLFYSKQSLNYSGIQEFMTTKKYQILEEVGEKVVWFGPEAVLDDGFEQEVSVISMLRKVNNVEKITEFNGIIEIQILEEKIQEIIRKANITENGVVAIYNQRGDFIAASEESKLKVLEINKIRSLENKWGWQKIDFNGEGYRIRRSFVENTDWEILAMVPESEIYEQAKQIQQIMWILFLLLGILSYGIAFLLTQNITRRIQKLTESMVKAQAGNLEVYVETSESDEIGQLYTSFNYMIQKLNEYTKQQYEDGKNIKSAEMKALQAQINPHFLYNTLDLINWKAREKEAPEIAQIAQALAKFYKLSLNKGKDIVSIKDELSHVEQYVRIQNMRFDHRIQYDCQVEEEIMEYQIPKIILQPIIENSIQHGILLKQEQSGTITISGQKKGNIIELVIRDDGIGMEVEVVASLLRKSNTKESHGYGIRNIHERLQLLYGEAYGLSYESVKNKGTKVVIQIPAYRE